MDARPQVQKSHADDKRLERRNFTKDTLNTSSIGVTLGTESMVHIVNPSKFYVRKGHHEAWSAVARFLGEMVLVQVLGLGLARVLVIER